MKYGPVAPSFIDIEDDMERAYRLKNSYIGQMKIMGHDKKVDGDGDMVMLEVDDKQFDHKDYWTRVGKPTLTNHKEVLVKEPLMRIVHKVIMGSLVHRAEEGGSELRQGHGGPRLGGDDYFTSAMLDFGGSSSGNTVGGSSRGAGFDDDDMDE
ncbi:hypothetical protein Tco_0799992 [Tanacetum coccineum]|uniref:Uncharacterized protein n=1 Tax=Tanacetum coccineum TaxID=301880 RepID=A0ABQ4ZRV5_9ASTR